MLNGESDSIVLMVLIAKRDLKDYYLSALSESGIHLVSASFGRGFVESGYVKHTFGLNKDVRTVVIFCVTSHTKTDSFLKSMTNEFSTDEPHNCIAVTMPIDKFLY